jgi:peptidylprolyl isomerase
MNSKKKYYIIYIFSLLLFSCSVPRHSKDNYVLIKTDLGDITVRLYNETPVHRDNFLKLVNSNVYDSITFHRVIKDFMIQAGDPTTKKNYSAAKNDTLSSYTIPAEFNRNLFHKRGALAAAREGNDVNPYMRSSGTQFYIVQGVKYSDYELNKAEEKINNGMQMAVFKKLMKEVSDSNRIAGTNLSLAAIQEKVSLKMFEIRSVEGIYKISEEQRNTYKTIGGAAHLDGTYTVFGEVVEGLGIVDKIANSQTDESDKPVKDIRILKMKVVRK